MTVIESNWNYRIDLKGDNYHEFETRLCDLGDDVMQLSGFKVQNYKDNGQIHDDELKILIEKNKQLRNDIDSKLEQLSRQKIQYESFKKDQKLLNQEVKDTHEAFLMAKKYYRKFLKMYFTIESRNGNEQTIFMQFFTEAKKEYEHYSIRLLRNTKTDHYQLLEMNPRLSIFEDVKKTLEETSDIPGAFFIIREAFMKVKKSKKL